MKYLWTGVLLIVVGAVLVALSTAYFVRYSIEKNIYSEEIFLEPGLAYKKCFFIKGGTNTTALLSSNGTYVFIIYDEYGNIFSNTTMLSSQQYINYTFDRDSSYCFLFMNNGNRSISLEYTFVLSSPVISEQYPFLTISGIIAVLAGIFVAFYQLVKQQDTYPPVISTDLVECRTIKLDKHVCYIDIEPSPGIEYILLSYYRERGFIERGKLGKCYFLKRHGKRYGKNIDLLICLAEKKIVIEYRLSPLFASGSIDLKDIYSEVRELCTRLAEETLFPTNE